MSGLTSSSRGLQGLTVSQGVWLLWTGGCLLGLVAAQFLFSAPAAGDDRLIASVGCLIFFVLGVAFFPALRKRQRQVLSLDDSGLVLHDYFGSKSWAWEEFDRLVWVRTGGSGGPVLVIEGAEGSRGGRMPRELRMISAHLKDVSPTASLVRIGYLDVDDLAIYEAIQQFSAGRFPERAPGPK